MARVIATELPDDLYRRLDGSDLDRSAGQVLFLGTVDLEGWPHPAMLSYFEVVAKDRQNIRLALYGDSGTMANIRRSCRLTISIVDEQGVYYIKGRVAELAGAMRCTPFNAKLNLRVEQVLTDRTDERRESGARIARGAVYVDPNLAAARRLADQVLKELLEG